MKQYKQLKTAIAHCNDVEDFDVKAKTKHSNEEVILTKGMLCGFLNRKVNGRVRLLTSEEERLVNEWKGVSNYFLDFTSIRKLKVRHIWNTIAGNLKLSLNDQYTLPDFVLLMKDIEGAPLDKLDAGIADNELCMEIILVSIIGTTPKGMTKTEAIKVMIRHNVCVPLFIDMDYFKEAVKECFDVCKDKTAFVTKLQDNFLELFPNLEMMQKYLFDKCLPFTPETRVNPSKTLRQGLREIPALRVDFAERALIRIQTYVDSLGEYYGPIVKICEIEDKPDYATMLINHFSMTHLNMDTDELPTPISPTAVDRNLINLLGILRDLCLHLRIAIHREIRLLDGEVRQNVLKSIDKMRMPNHPKVPVFLSNY